jgi:hypothetical protein
MNLTSARCCGIVLTGLAYAVKNAVGGSEALEYIQKPFDITVLARVVAAAIGSVSRG